MDDISITDFIAARLEEDQSLAEETLARWPPAALGDRRVQHWQQTLVDVAAKRAIRGLHTRNEPGKYTPLPYCDCQCEDGIVLGTWPCQTMRFIAGVWADHPDYRQEWRPE